MDWSVILQGGIFLVAMSAFYLTSSSRYLTIREHTEYKEATNAAIKSLQTGEDERIKRVDVQRELDQLIHRISIIEQTRPTTGELEARFYRISNNGSNQKH